MHLPDGFLGPKSSAAFMAAALASIAFAFRKVMSLITEPALVKAFAMAGDKIRSITEKGGRVLSAGGSEYLGRLAIVSSFIFALQMFNFPVAHGTSGHFIGAVFAAVILGPWGGLLAISVILSIQSLFFSDGGIAALGTNIFNMGLIAAVGGFFLYQGLKYIRIPSIISASIAATTSVIAASAACAIEIGFSGAYNFKDTLVSMVSIHTYIGAAEGAMTLVLIILCRKLLGWKEQ